jgi:hypothetical protein
MAEHPPTPPPSLHQTCRQWSCRHAVCARWVSQTSQAAPVRLQEIDPKASEVGYTEAATKSNAQKEATETCADCNLHSGKDGAVDGPCALFQDNLVSADGWCTAWASAVVRSDR